MAVQITKNSCGSSTTSSRSCSKTKTTITTITSPTHGRQITSEHVVSKGTAVVVSKIPTITNIISKRRFGGCLLVTTQNESIRYPYRDTSGESSGSSRRPKVIVQGLEREESSNSTDSTNSMSQFSVSSLNTEDNCDEIQSSRKGTEMSCVIEENNDDKSTSSTMTTSTPSPSCTNGPLSTPTSSTKRMNVVVRKRVRFSTADYYFHGIMLGDHPAVSCGVPITIEWKAFESVVLTIDELDAARGNGVSSSSSKAGLYTPRTMNEMLLPKAVREQYVMNTGVSKNTILRLDYQIRKAQRDQKITTTGFSGGPSRSQQKMNAPWIKLSKVSSFFSRK